MKNKMEKVHITAELLHDKDGHMMTLIDTMESNDSAMLLVATKLILEDVSKRLKSGRLSSQECITLNRMRHFLSLYHKDQVFSVMGQHKVLQQVNEALRV